MVPLVDSYYFSYDGNQKESSSSIEVALNTQMVVLIKRSITHHLCVLYGT